MLTKAGGSAGKHVDEAANLTGEENMYLEFIIEAVKCLFWVGVGFFGYGVILGWLARCRHEWYNSHAGSGVLWECGKCGMFKRWYHLPWGL